MRESPGRSPKPTARVLGQQVTPLDRVGLYVPGGKAAYPSSVLMNAMPAQVAGVRRVHHGRAHAARREEPLVLAAATLAGVDRVFTIGGAQAIAALAYGTATIPQVDKIVGPGNAYVAAAKRRVFGTVGIDMVAGSSEILVICDGTADPDWIAMDLFSQAEHDESRRRSCSRPTRLSSTLSKQHRRAASRHAAPRHHRRSLAGRGALIQRKRSGRSLRHCQPHRARASGALGRRPGALRRADPQCRRHLSRPLHVEALGDYCAGPNHVLPTSRTARFSSPLGVYDFQKRTSVIAVAREGAQRSAGSRRRWRAAKDCRRTRAVPSSG